MQKPEKLVITPKEAAEIKGIDYPNFKGAVREASRHDAYLGVWRVMDRFGGSHPMISR